MKCNKIRHRWLGVFAGLFVLCNLTPVEAITIDFQAGEGANGHSPFNDALALLGFSGFTAAGLPYMEDGFDMMTVDTGVTGYRYSGFSGLVGLGTITPALAWTAGETVRLEGSTGQTFSLLDFLASNAIYEPNPSSLDLTLTLFGTYAGGGGTVQQEFTLGTPGEIGVNEFATVDLDGRWTGLEWVEFRASGISIPAIDHINLEFASSQAVPDGGSTGILFTGVLATLGWARRRMD